MRFGENDIASFDFDVPLTVLELELDMKRHTGLYVDGHYDAILNNVNCSAAQDSSFASRSQTYKIGIVVISFTQLFA